MESVKLMTEWGEKQGVGHSKMGVVNKKKKLTFLWGNKKYLVECPGCSLCKLAFLRAPAATVTYSKYEQPVWFLAPLKRPFSFQAVIVCIPIQRLQSPTPIWPAALGNNVRFHHPCKHEFFFLSLSLSLFVPYGTGIKCTSEHFALYCTIKSYLPSELVSARTFQIILETHLSQKVA